MMLRGCRLTHALAGVLFLGFLPAWGAKLSMKEHMEIETQPQADPALTGLPSIHIDSIQATVPVNNRMNADDAFDRSFTDSLADGMAWYLKQRGLRMDDQGADLRITGTIESYEGWKGWGHWGADVHLKVKFFRGSQMVLIEDLRSFLKYHDDEDVEDQEKPKYEARHLSVRFPEVLFTRVGMDLSEKLITVMKEKADALLYVEPAPAKAAPEGRGKLTFDATVPNAEVVVDGRLVGTTPLLDFQLPATTHSIEIRKQGFKPWKREVAVIEGASSRITAELEPTKPE